MALQGLKPKKGDLIKFQRICYQHWGIYIGKGMVVHLTGEYSYISSFFAFGGPVVVKIESLERVADGCTYMVNNKYDIKRIPFPPTKIVRAALEQVGKKMNYSVFTANCEHFVTELRYGIGFSDQGDDAKTYAVGIFAVILVVLITIMRFIILEIYLETWTSAASQIIIV